MPTEKKKPFVPPEEPPLDTYTETVQYALDWSAAANSCPDWFRDAKFGVYFHWGPYCVPEFDSEWYSRNMYAKGHPANLHHIEHYGSISAHGYKDLLGEFTGEHFDADAWATLMARSGAKYFAACAEHADNFSMWPSAVNPVNAMHYGPKRDVMGELKAAADKQGLRFGATLHHSWNWGWFCSSDPAADVYDPKNVDFYGPALPMSATRVDPEPFPDEAFQRTWLEKCKEVIDRYLPDTIYFDGRVYIIEEKYRREFAAYYHEAARKAGKEVIFTYKSQDFHPTSGILDYECLWQPNILPQPWQGDDKSVWFTWCHIQNGQYKPVQGLIHQLADIVSKNGNFLLNVGPKKDGTFADETVAQLEGIGDWLAVNGEAIYGTRPFAAYGEGPTLQTKDRVTFPPQIVPFTCEDMRFTQKDGAVYAILLGWPHAGKASVSTLCTRGALQAPVRRVTMLGDGAALPFVQDETALTVTLPQHRPCQHAYVLKIEC